MTASAASTSTKGKGPRFATGAKRLDILFEGGLRRGDTALLHGPPFLGKATLAHQAIRHSLDEGIPVIAVTTSEEASRFIEHVGITQTQRKLLHVIDTLGASIGGEEDLEGVTVVDGAADLNGMAAAINGARAKLQGHHEDHLLVVDSLSTLILHTNAAAVFRFIQVVLGMGRRAGAHSILLLDDPMHDPKETESFKHLCTGTIEMRDRESKQQVRLLGFELKAHLGWVDYRTDGRDFDVTGSFAAGRIR